MIVLLSFKRRIHLEGNCLVVIQAVNSIDPCISYTGTLVTEVKQLLNFCNAWKASFIYKEGNLVVDYLATFFCSPNFLLPLFLSLSFFQKK